MLLKVCSSSMAGENRRRSKLCQTVAVILLLCSLVLSLTCFSLRGLSKKVPQDKVVSEAAVMEIKTENILFNGSGSASAAVINDGLLPVDSDQSDGTEMFEQTSQLKDVIANEAAWRRLNLTLHCGRTKMKLNAMGPGAADLQLDKGNARLLPLIQVPETCGYSVQQNAVGLVLVVPYNGCNVIQENGNYVVPLSWLETPVKLTCPMLPSPHATPGSTPPKPAQYPWKLPFPHRPWSLHRHKRQANLPTSIYDPSSPYYPYLYYYLMYMRPIPNTAPPTTAKPDTTTITTKPIEARPPMRPPAYPYPPYYLYYPYYFYYPYYPLPNLPVRTTVPPATTTVPPATTTVPLATTTGPSTTLMTTTAGMTTSASTTKTPQNPSIPNFPPYFYYPYYPPVGHPFPVNPNGSEIYYYPVIQHFYGKPPYPLNPSQTTQPPTLTTKPSDTAKPSDSSPTTKPTTASALTTASTPTTASAPTAQTTSSSSYPGPMSPYISYDQLPFVPYVSYKYNKAGKLPDYQKYMPQAGYKSGPQARAYPHPGFQYWQPFPHSRTRRSSMVWKK